MSDQNPDNAIEYLNRGNKYYSEKKYDDAIADYDHAIELNPSYVEAYNNRGNVWQNKAEYDKAIVDFDRAIELNPSYASTYNNRGIVWGNRAEYDKAVVDFDRAIELNPSYVEAYNNRGIVWDNKAEYDKAITDYDRAIELNPSYASAYNNRGNVWQNKAEYDKAIADYGRAIELNPNDAEAYNNRGIAWDNKGEYDKAIADYDRAIELNPSYVEAYNNRGIVWDNKAEYDKAIADYDRAIELKLNYASAYNNRAIAWRNQEKYDESLKDYNYAIELKPDYASAYTNRGILWYNQEQFDKAISDFEQAIALDPDFESAKYWRDKAKAQLGETTVVDKQLSDTSIYFFYKAVESLREGEIKRSIIQSSVGVIDAVDIIRKCALIPSIEAVSHYTKLRIADAVVSCGESKLHYYNVVYMNDPDEGKILFNVLQDNIITASFEAGKLQENDNNVYIGSFLPAADADKLDMWIAYGKDEKNTPAAGCSLTINSDFFDKESGYLQQGIRTNSNDNEKGDENKSVLSQCLYRVLYYDKIEGRVKGYNEIELNAAVDKLRTELKNLISLKDANSDAIQNSIIDSIVYRSLLELRYFFKLADYDFEHEIRVIQYVAMDDDRIQIDDNGGQGLPRRLYIESVKPIQPHLQKIMLGPSVPYPERWMYLEAIMRKKGYKIEVKASQKRYR